MVFEVGWLRTLHDDGWNNLEVIWIVLKDLSLVNFEEQSVDLVYQVPKARSITALYNCSDPLNEGCQTPHPGG